MQVGELVAPIPTETAAGIGTAMTGPLNQFRGYAGNPEATEVRSAS
jgi:hypothetical protein